MQNTLKNHEMEYHFLFSGFPITVGSIVSNKRGLKLIKSIFKHVMI
jgi:hypothetical protein